MSRRVLITGGVVAVLAVVVVMVVVGSGRSSRAEPPPTTRVAAVSTLHAAATPTPTAAPPLGPTGAIDGVPAGWRHDGAGARAAAIAYVSLTPKVAKAGFVTQRDMVLRLATAAYGPTLASVTVSQVDEIVFALGAHDVSPADLVVVEQPVTAQVQAATADRVTVAVWSVVVVGVPGSVPPQQVWRTVTVTLAWERGDWRIDDWTVTAGPNPAAPPEVQPADYRAIAVVAAWPPASVEAG